MVRSTRFSTSGGMILLIAPARVAESMRAYGGAQEAAHRIEQFADNQRAQ
jgi:hypothetical protein